MSHVYVNYSSIANDQWENSKQKHLYRLWINFIREIVEKKKSA